MLWIYILNYYRLSSNKTSYMAIFHFQINELDKQKIKFIDFMKSLLYFYESQIFCISF